MRIGISVRTIGPDFCERVTAWEAKGAATIWTADHLGMADPFVPLAAIADTTSMQLGTLVINHDFWHPALLARAAGTLARIAPGRVVLGIGAGHAEVEYDALGLTYERPMRRVERMIDLADVAMRLLRGETVGHANDWWTLSDCHLGAAVPEHAPKLLIGGNGNRVLTAGALHADEIGYTGFTSGTGRTHTDLSHFTWDGLAERMAYVSERTHDRAIDSNVLVQHVEITADRRRTLAPWEDRTSLTLDELLDSPFVLVGTPNEIAAQVHRLASMGIGEVCCFDHHADVLLDAMARA
jgi:probable F420-dependent oxidoreductase